MNTRRWLVAVLVGMSLLTERSSMAADSKSAVEACQKGKSYFDKQDYDAAIVAFTEAIRLDRKMLWHTTIGAELTGGKATLKCSFRRYGGYSAQPAIS